MPKSKSQFVLRTFFKNNNPNHLCQKNKVFIDLVVKRRNKKHDNRFCTTSNRPFLISSFKHFSQDLRMLITFQNYDSGWKKQLFRNKKPNALLNYRKSSKI